MVVMEERVFSGRKPCDGSEDGTRERVAITGGDGRPGEALKISVTVQTAMEILS